MPLDEALQGAERHWARLSARDRALAGQLVRTTLRRRGQMQELLGGYLRKPLAKGACKAWALLLMGAAQVLFLRVPAHAAIDTCVRLAKADRRMARLAGLMNAVLRRVSESGAEKLKALPETLNIPSWLRRNWRAAYGAAALKEMAQELMREPGLDISVKDPAQAEAWARRLGGVVLPTGSIRIAKPSAPVPEMAGFAQGEWWVQDAAAALPVKLAGELQGKRVADLCAAPGGKTAQLAAAGADVVAVDVSARRLARLEENLARLRLSARIVESDVLRFDPEEKFDLVLLDAPCTATGTYRRHPDVLWAKTPAQMRELADLQARMLRHAAGLVKKGGMLIYCVCALQPEEGEARAARFLREQRGRFARLPVAAEELAGLAHLVNAQGEVRTLPHHAIGAARGMDGFFIARFVRG